jgi:hypothetical protein
MPPSDSQSAVFAKFLGKEILGEWGRLLFSLIGAFHNSGFAIHLYDNLRDQELGKYGPLVFSLGNVRRTIDDPVDTGNLIYLFDREDPLLGKRKWRKKVRVAFDVYRSYAFESPIIMPYPVHPAHAGPGLRPRIERCRSLPKSMTIFFAGDTEGYKRNRIHYPEEKIPRLPIVEAIRRRLNHRLLIAQTPGELAQAIDGGAIGRFVLAEPKSIRIDPGGWLETIARASFFLCPPGYVMPMCHNITEAMAVGTIPITNYPEWLDPHLTHLDNCIAFRTEDDLIEKLERVCGMSDAEATQMRRRVLDYYERYLTTESFVQRVTLHQDNEVTVLMITDANVATNERKLGPRSILMRGTVRSGDKKRCLDLVRLLAGRP